jgi:uncharacterized membrane protein
MPQSETDAIVIALGGVAIAASVFLFVRANWVAERTLARQRRLFGPTLGGQFASASGIRLASIGGFIVGTSIIFISLSNLLHR